MQSDTQKNSKFLAQLCFQKGEVSSMEQAKGLSVQFLEACLDDPKCDRALGCMFGAFIADALGSYCEFKLSISPDLLVKTMSMPGGGTFCTKSGQFTDDSELASHLLGALENYNFEKEWSEQQNSQMLFKIANSYKNWYQSGPFDIGNTTRAALNSIKSDFYDYKCSKMKGEQEPELGKFMYKAIRKIDDVTYNSESNGSLMRITPMAFFLSLQGNKLGNPLKNKDFIKSQVNITHGSQKMKQAGFIWVELLYQLISRNQTGKSLFEIHREFIAMHEIDQQLNQWIQEAKSEKYMSATQNMGWAKIAFSFGIKKLKLLAGKNEQEFVEQDYIDHISDVIGRAGDTDTNGAIVGGVIGSVLGFSRLPVEYLTKQFQLRLDGTNSCQGRLQEYQPRLQLVRALKMIKNSYSISKGFKQNNEKRFQNI